MPRFNASLEPEYNTYTYSIYEKNIFEQLLSSLHRPKEQKVGFFCTVYYSNDLICGFSDSLVEKDDESELF
jgi:hypothetical protein